MLLASFNELITCNASDCLSWIIVLFNILTVFYLAFCAWFKITKAVKLFGWVWTALNVCVTIVLIFFHTCIFTLISAVFTGLITMATLSVVFNGGKGETKESSVDNDSKIKGYYVIFNTTDNKFVFRLYDSSKKYFMTSCYKYSVLDEVKKAIALSRKSGIDVMLEDRTSNWIKAVNIPKFVLTGDCDKYYFKYVITEKLTIMRSEDNKDIVECTKTVRKIMDAVLSNEVYFSKEVLNGTLFKQAVAEVKPVKKQVVVKAKPVKSQTIAEAKPVKKQVVVKAKPVEIQTIAEVKPVKQVVEEVAVTDDSAKMTLTESFKMAKSFEAKATINKKFIADYLEEKYGKSVIVNRRENLIKSGKLPLADTHYTVVGDNKKCFIYVYETEGATLTLIKASTSYAKTLQHDHKNVRFSAFPRSQDAWYSIVLDDSWTAEEVRKMLDDVKALNDKELSYNVEFAK